MKLIIIIVIFNVVFNIIFSQLRRSKPQAFSLFEKIPKRWKEKYTYKWIVLIPALTICAILFTLLNVGDMVSGIIAGFVMSLVDIAFTKPQV